MSAGGVDLGNLTLEEATAKLQDQLGARFARPLLFGAGGRLFRLAPEDASFSFDALTTAKRALRHKPPAGQPAGTPASVPLALSHSRLAVRAFVADVAKKLYRAPRSARLRITLRRMVVRRVKHGRGIDRAAVERAISAALDDESAPRSLRARLRKVSPKVSVADLRRRYATVITIDRSNFRLRLFKRLRFVKSYGVAVGQPAYPTPTGLFSISNKQVNPNWSVPNSPWAGELAGSTVSGNDPSNPLKARWMGIVNGVGIHGTGQPWTIGSRASHGCIRMRVPDVIDLYRRVPVGTRVLIR